MSLEGTLKLDCPKCRHSQQVVIWRTLNVDVSPEARKDFMEGRINVMACQRCGNEAQISVPFMYHDMRRQVCAQYYPPESIKDVNFLNRFDRAATINTAMIPGSDIPDYMRNQHVVFDMEELVRYVMFRERLYDHYAFRPPG
jgi:hypothetical protein